MYTVKEFRANLRKCLNEASQGDEVLVQRWGQIFEIKCVEDKPQEGEIKFCPHGQVKGFCKKGCK